MTNQFASLNIKKIAWFSAGAIFFIIDRCLKIIALNNIHAKLIGNWLNFNFVPNRNIAFSLPISGPWLNAAIGLIIIGIILYLYRVNINWLEKFSLFLILIGAISNLADRLFYGYVIDYFDLSWFTIFNLADVSISIGTATLLYYIIKKTPV